MTPKRRRRSLGRLDRETGLLVFEGCTRLTDIAAALHWPLVKTAQRLAERGIEARPRAGFPAGRWVDHGAARDFLIETHAQRKARA